VLVPTPEVLRMFVAQVQPWHELVVQNLRESRALTALRDTLLPKLLSGEVRLKQAGKLVEAAL
jgi:type I restriction enzyme S subunit